MHRKLTIFFLVTLSLTLISPVEAVANTKLGQACKTLGSTFITKKEHLTCRTVNSAKVWTKTIPDGFGKNNGVVIGGPCQKVGDLYWEGMARVECVNKNGRNQYQIKVYPKQSKENRFIDGEVRKLIARASSIKIDYKPEIRVQPGYENKLWTKEIEAGYNGALRLLAAMGINLKETPPTLIFWDFEWAKDKLPSYCRSWANNAGGGLCGNELLFYNLGWNATSGNWILNDPNKFQDDAQKINIAGNVGHEVAHFAQSLVYAQTNNSTSTVIPNDYKPAWLREGAVEVFKSMVYALNYNLTYTEARNLQVHTFGNRCTPISLKNLSETKSYPDSCEYNNGSLAVEYLVAKKRNLNALFDWERKDLDTQRLDQAGAFKRAFGLDFQSFMSEADNYIKQETK